MPIGFNINRIKRVIPTVSDPVVSSPTMMADPRQQVKTTPVAAPTLRPVVSDPVVEEVVNLNADPFVSTVSSFDAVQESLIPKDISYQENVNPLVYDSRIPPMIWDASRKMNVPNPAYVAPDYSGLELLKSLGTDYDFSNIAELSKQIQQQETEKYGLIAQPEDFNALESVDTAAQNIYLDEANKMIKDFGVEKEDAEQWYSDILEFTEDRPVYGLDVSPELSGLAEQKTQLQDEGYVNKTNEWVNELEGLKQQDPASFTSSFNEMPTQSKLQYLYSAYEKGDLTEDQYKENFKNTVNANYDPQTNPNTKIIIDIKGNDYLVDADSVYGQMTDPFFLKSGAFYADDSLYFPSEEMSEGAWLQSIGSGQKSAEDKISDLLEPSTASFFLNNPVTQIAGLVIPGFSAATTLAKAATGETLHAGDWLTLGAAGLDYYKEIVPPSEAQALAESSVPTTVIDPNTKLEVVTKTAGENAIDAAFDKNILDINNVDTELYQEIYDTAEGIGEGFLKSGFSQSEISDMLEVAKEAVADGDIVEGVDYQTIVSDFVNSKPDLKVHFQGLDTGAEITSDPLVSPTTQAVVSETVGDLLTAKDFFDEYNEFYDTELALDDVADAFNVSNDLAEGVIQDIITTNPTATITDITNELSESFGGGVTPAAEVAAVAPTADVAAVADVAPTADVAETAATAAVAKVADVAAVAPTAEVAKVAETAAVAAIAKVADTADVAEVAKVAEVAATASVAEQAAVAAVADVAEVAEVAAVAAVAAVAPTAEVAKVAETAAVAAVADVADVAKVAEVAAVAATAAVAAVADVAETASVAEVAKVAEVAATAAVADVAAVAEVAEVADVSGIETAVAEGVEAIGGAVGEGIAGIGQELTGLLGGIGTDLASQQAKAAAATRTTDSLFSEMLQLRTKVGATQQRMKPITLTPTPAAKDYKPSQVNPIQQFLQQQAQLRSRPQGMLTNSGNFKR